MAAPWLRRLRWPLSLLAMAVLLVLIATIPVSTRQGVNWVVTTHRLPLYEKAIEFVQRDRSYSRLVTQIVAGRSTDEERVIAVYHWTRQNIRDVPPGFPVIDDHVWNIVIRGYGQPDQKVDVFTTLVSYAGIPAYWMLIGRRPAGEVPIGLAKIGGGWRVFDVDAGIVFRNRRNQLATAEELATDPSLVAAAAGGRIWRGRPYVGYFEGFRAPRAPDITRAEMQMLWPRLSFEAKRMMGQGGRMWDPRPEQTVTSQ